MLDWIRVRARTLRGRLFIGFILIILITLVAAGVPTLWLVRAELEAQAQARLDQGVSSTQAVFKARISELQAVANLTAERPTLRALLQSGNQAALPTYLDSIASTSHVDFLVALDAAGRVLAHTRLPAGWDETAARFLADGASTQPDVAIIHLQNGTAVAIRFAAPVSGDNGTSIGRIVSALPVGDSMVGQLRDETGLHHSVYSSGSRVATTLPEIAASEEAVTLGTTTIGGTAFMLQRIALEPGLVDVVALPTDDIAATETRVLDVLLITAAGVILLGGLLGYLIGVRVSAPLRELSRATEGIGRGDLGTPIPYPEAVSEVSAMALTLEKMRTRLQEAYRELEQAKRWSENLIASLAEGVLTVDPTGKITSFSPGAERILGWRSTDVIGRSLAIVFAGAAGEESRRDMVAQRVPGSVRRERISTREGKQLVLLVTSGAITRRSDGSEEQALVLHDVTQDEEAIRMREFFLANVSHELKTPLSSLRASVELLATEHTSLTDDETMELVNSLWLGTIRMEELVDNLLSSASIRSGRFQMRLVPVDLESVVEAALATTRPLVLLRKQWLETDLELGLPFVLADARRLGQVFINLISNASKYGPAGAPIRVRAEQRRGEVLVQVVDEGQGIAAELMPLIFQPFKRSDDPTRGGVGLGLSIVSTIIQGHGGEVGVNSEPGNGTAFWFTLRACEQTDADA